MQQLAVASFVGSTLGTLSQFTDDEVDIENQALVGDGQEQEQEQHQQHQGAEEDNDDDDDEEEDDVQEAQKKKKPIKGNLFKYGIQGMAATTFGAALASSIMIDAGLVDAYCILTLAVASLVFWQKCRLQKMGGLRGQHNIIRTKINRFSVENHRLTASVDGFEEQVKNLKHVEQGLADYAERAGGQVNRLIEFGKEYGEVQDKMKEILNQDVVEQIITTMLNTDNNTDYILSKREVMELEHRLKNIPGVVFHHDRFQAFIASDQGELSIGDVAKLARQLQDPTVPDTERVFQHDMLQVKKFKQNSNRKK